MSEVLITLTTIIMRYWVHLGSTRKNVHTERKSKRGREKHRKRERKREITLCNKFVPQKEVNFLKLGNGSTHKILT